MAGFRSSVTVSVNERFQDVLAEEDLFYQVCRTAVDDNSRRLLVLALWNWKVSASHFFADNGKPLGRKALCDEIQQKLKVYASAKARGVVLNLPVRAARFVVDWILYYTAGKRVKTQREPATTFDLLQEGQCAARIFAANYRNDQLQFVQLLQKQCQKRVDAEEKKGVYGDLAADLTALKNESYRDGTFNVDHARRYLLSKNEAILSALTLVRPSGALRKNFVEISQAMKMYQPGYQSFANVNATQFGVQPAVEVKRRDETKAQEVKKPRTSSKLAKLMQEAKRIKESLVNNPSLETLVSDFDSLVSSFQKNVEAVVYGDTNVRQDIRQTFADAREALETKWDAYFGAPATTTLSEAKKTRGLFARYQVSESLLKEIVDLNHNKHQLHGIKARSEYFVRLAQFQTQLLQTVAGIQQTVLEQERARRKRIRRRTNEITRLQEQVARGAQQIRRSRK